MLEWAMTHPWMTFFLIGLALLVLDGAITNMFRFLNNILRVISATTSKRGRVISNKKFACSECAYGNGRKQTNYCPNCGAKMNATDINVGDKEETK